MFNETSDVGSTYARFLQQRQTPGLSADIRTAGIPPAPLSSIGNFNSAAPQILTSLDNQMRSQIEAGDELKKFNLQNLLGSNVLGSLTKPTALSTGGLKVPGTMAEGMAKTGEGFKMPGIASMAQAGMGLASGIANFADINHSDLNGTQKNIARGDAAVSAISQIAPAFGPIGMAAGAGLSLINSVGGALIGTPKEIKNFSLNSDVAASGGYGGVTANANDLSATGQSYQKAGLFGKLFGGAGKIKNQMRQSNAQQALVAGEVQNNQEAFATAAGSAGMATSRYANQLNGTNKSFTNRSVLFGQQGMKLLNGINRNPKVNPTAQEKAANYSKGKTIVDPMDEVLSVPQKATVWATGNGYQKPSEAMNIQNPYGAFATDFVLDPMNFLAVGEASKFTEAGKLLDKARTSNMVHGIELGFHPKSLNRAIGKKHAAVGSVITDKGFDSMGGTQTAQIQSPLLNRLMPTRYQQGGVLYNPISKPQDEELEFEGLTDTPVEDKVADDSILTKLRAQRRMVELQNQELENQISLNNKNATDNSSDITSSDATGNSSADTKFKEFENVSLQRLQALHPGKKVEVTYEQSGVYNKDGSRNWETQAELLKKGASKTGLSLHNFGAAKDYRLKVDGKIIDPGNTKLYKEVLWNAAKETGLHTVGDWDVAHVGLAQEGKGSTWEQLAQNYPDVFKSKIGANTLESLKRAGQSKYLNQLAGPLATLHKSGGKIHIKKKNEGKFTKYKERTGKTTSEALHSKNESVRKMAQFAKNAKKFKHEEGGVLELFKDGGVMKAKNVIVHGKLHAHKHALKKLKDLREAEITHKGIPVITKDAEGGVMQHSEVEGQEIVLHYDLTMKLEELRKDGSDEALIKAGKLLARELMRNTKDKTGTLRSIRDAKKEEENDQNQN